ncbi:MAG: sulfatase-like hydrolase/transferase [Candidatus Synoicihabitans palmerolidicus]|nr:sulfatase-like hydrolase/transferase [Candidatus Synoicihabitans palmerolidicus]
MEEVPNILWVVTTQWRASAWGGGGDKQACTPNLDQLATEGLVYRQATTPHPFGPFARAAMLTGVPSPENGVCDYFDPLPTRSETIAHRMTTRGYDTAWFGKWHLAKRDPQAPLVGEAHARMVVAEAARGGFEYWEGFESGFLLHDPWLHGTRYPEPMRVKGYQSDVLADTAIDWVQTREQVPWFAVVSIEAPHPPYGAAVPEEIERVNSANLRRPDNVPVEVWPRAAAELAGYYTHIAATDRAIGRLVRGMGKTTVVVVTSVHGDMHGAHGLFRKGWPYEESVRVPLMVRGAPHEEAGSISDGPVSLLDMGAMTLAWSEGRKWESEREWAPISMPSVVKLPDQCDRVWSGRRSMKHKEIRRADGSPWLEFDLQADPGEQRSLV